MVLGSIFSPDFIKMDLESEDKEEVFEEMVELYASSTDSVSRSAILSALRNREAKLSTGIKSGYALPHAQTDQVKAVQGIIGISHKGIDYDALDGKPVHVIFMLLASTDDYSFHLRVLKRLSLLIEDPEFYQNIINQKDPSAVYSTICKFEDILTTSM
jgi:mannitol/fructose-specific phosphotransferase system IIA component (Ntr-type)